MAQLQTEWLPGQKRAWRQLADPELETALPQIGMKVSGPWPEHRGAEFEAVVTDVRFWKAAKWRGEKRPAGEYAELFWQEGEQFEYVLATALWEKYRLVSRPANPPPLPSADDADKPPSAKQPRVEPRVTTSGGGQATEAQGPAIRRCLQPCTRGGVCQRIFGKCPYHTAVFTMYDPAVDPAALAPRKETPKEAKKEGRKEVKKEGKKATPTSHHRGAKKGSPQEPLALATTGSSLVWNGLSSAMPPPYQDYVPHGDPTALSETVGWGGGQEKEKEWEEEWKPEPTATPTTAAPPAPPFAPPKPSPTAPPSHPGVRTLRIIQARTNTPCNPMLPPF